MPATPSSDAINIVLVHGGFVDGSGWEGVYGSLRKDGYTVSVVQNPTISLADDVQRQARRRRAERPRDPRRPLLRRRGDHRGRQRSEGGGAGLHRRLCPGQGRVGVLADQGSTAGRARCRRSCRRRTAICSSTRRSSPPPSPPTWTRSGRRSWRTPRSRGASRRSSGAISEPAWKTKPSWYLVATDDRMIPPPAQRFMSKRAGATVVEVAGSHAVYVSQPDAVADLIVQAAKGSEAMAHAG